MIAFATISSLPCFFKMEKLLTVFILVLVGFLTNSAPAGGRVYFADPVKGDMANDGSAAKP